MDLDQHILFPVYRFREEECRLSNFPIFPGYWENVFRLQVIDPHFSAAYIPIGIRPGVLYLHNICHGTRACFFLLVIVSLHEKLVFPKHLMHIIRGGI